MQLKVGEERQFVQLAPAATIGRLFPPWWLRGSKLSFLFSLSHNLFPVSSVENKQQSANETVLWEKSSGKILNVWLVFQAVSIHRICSVQNILLSGNFSASVCLHFMNQNRIFDVRAPGFQVSVFKNSRLVVKATALMKLSIIALHDSCNQSIN